LVDGIIDGFLDRSIVRNMWMYVFKFKVNWSISGR